jgi:hypothetical protein
MVMRPRMLDIIIKAPWNHIIQSIRQIKVRLHYPVQQSAGRLLHAFLHDFQSFHVTLLPPQGLG